MTEAEWHSYDGHPLELLIFWDGDMTTRQRKWRLFVCACCRHIWHLIPDARSRAAVEMGERFADGLVSEEELCRAGLAAQAVLNANSDDLREFCLSRAALTAAITSLCDFDIVHHAVADIAYGIGDESEYSAQSDLARDIFGNPFRNIQIDSALLNDSVVSLCREIYETRAFDRMPDLAGALTDSGISDSELLNHCRAAHEHAKGCWVLDLILGRPGAVRAEVAADGSDLPS